MRSLFAGKRQVFHTDFLALLQTFQGNRLNWDIEPYLCENAALVNSGQPSQALLETALASERLAALDRAHFLATGQFKFNLTEHQMEAAARKHISAFAKLSQDGLGEALRGPWLALYAGVLKLALLQLQRPKTSAAAQKIKEFLRFMAEELSGIFALLVTLAVERFSGGRRACILDRLQPGAKDLVPKARNIAWDLFHHQRLYQQAAFLSKRAEFLVPCFLTFDEDLAAVFELYPIKACLIQEPRVFPQLFPAVSLQSLLQNAVHDDSFLRTYFTPEASQRRADRMDNNPPTLDPLVSRLEAELAKYDSTNLLTPCKQ